MTDHWESDIAALLAELSASQGEMLALLAEKRQMLARSDNDGLVELQQREATLIDRLQACHERRQQLLARADAAGLPADSIDSLTDAIPGDERGQLQRNVEAARQQARLLQHQSLTNWVVVQRSLLHLSQMLEIIATGGQRQPTYKKGPPQAPSGALVDRAV